MRSQKIGMRLKIVRSKTVRAVVTQALENYSRKGNASQNQGGNKGETGSIYPPVTMEKLPVIKHFKT